MHQMLAVLTTINPKKSLLWDPDLGPSSLSGEDGLIGCGGDMSGREPAKLRWAGL